MSKLSLLAFLPSLALASPALADADADADAADAAAAEPALSSTAPPAPSRWGVEAELVQPFIPEVHILSARVTRTLWGAPGGPRGDLSLGVYARPRVAHNIVETIDEYLVSVGYRQYLWRGLHVEAAALAGWAWGENNKIDGMDYSNPVLLVEGLAGYRVDLRAPVDSAGRPQLGFYVTPQVGGLAGVITDIGPRGGKSDLFVVGKLLAGVSF
jgi:hypothetical protein